MNILTPAELRKKLEAKFPLDATGWDQATDEIRDLCRWGRGMLGLDEDHAVDFRELRTPSAWNTQGINGIIRFYELMSDDMKADYVQMHKHLWGDGIEEDE
jgi:hypothetical protein